MDPLLSDYQLVQKSLESSDFFAEIVERYESNLSHFLQRIGAIDEAERADLLQEVFVKIYIHLNEVDENQSFSAWIYRIARNTFYDFYRKSSVRGKKLEFNDKESEIFWNSIPDLSQDIPDHFDRDLLRVFVRDKIETLSQPKRDIFILFFLEEKSYEEISDILHMNSNSVATHLSRGKKMLKKTILNDKKSPFLVEK